MRTLRLLITVIAFCLGFIGISQTPEQQKMMEQAQRQYDSIMNTPQMKKQMEDAEKMSRQFETTNARKKSAKKEISQNVTKPSNKDNHLLSASSKMKFDNWKNGDAEIFLLTAGRYSEQTYTKIGAIGANGYFDFTLPEKMTTYFTIDSDRFLNCRNNNKTTWTRSQTRYSTGNLIIKKGDQNLGTIFLTSSRDIIKGQTLASDYHGRPGYWLMLYYLDGETSAKTNCIIQRRYGEGKDYDLTKNFNLQLKPGWNMVKFEYTGPRIDIDWGEGEHNKHSYFKEEKIYVVPELPSDIRWFFNSSI